MTRERAEELVSDLLDACWDYEHAPQAQVEKIRRDFHQKRAAMIDMLSLICEQPAAPNMLLALLPLASLPFEECRIDAGQNNDSTIIYSLNTHDITIRDVRAARAAIAQATGGQS